MLAACCLQVLSRLSVQDSSMLEGGSPRCGQDAEGSATTDTQQHGLQPHTIAHLSDKIACQPDSLLSHQPEPATDEEEDTVVTLPEIKGPAELMQGSCSARSWQQCPNSAWILVLQLVIAE